MRNLNEVLRKDVTYDNIKSHKKPGLDPLSLCLSVSLSVCLSLSLSLQDTFLEKLPGTGQIDPPAF